MTPLAAPRHLLRFLALAFALVAPGAAASTLPSFFQESAVITGLVNPTAVRFAANGQIFVAEKSGRVLVFDGIGDSLPTQVVDLGPSVHNFWDRGLLGLAIDPGWPARPYLYALYTHDAMPGSPIIPRWGDTCPTPPGATDDGCVVQGRLVRIDVDPITMIGTERVLIEGNWCQQYPSHSVGDLAFGADGMLYLSAGDGASFNFADWGQDGSPVNPCGDPAANPSNPAPPSAQGGALRSQDILTSGDPQSYDGAVLRIDVSNPALGAQVPANNPLRANSVPGDDYIVAHGLRNPFRITARPGTNEIWITDVGWNTWEEIDRIANPTDSVIENFGWPCFEGASATSERQGGYDSANLTLCENLYANGTTNLGGGVTDVVTPSIYAYRHDAQVLTTDGCPTGSSSATGAAFYQGGDYPGAYTNALFFADSSRKCIWTIFADGAGNPNPANRGAFVSNAAGRVVDVQIGPGGDVFYVDFDGGNVFRVEYFPLNTPPTAVIHATPTSGIAPLLVQLDASASTDPEGTAGLTYAWDLDGDGAFDDSTAIAPTATIPSGSHVVALRVTDPLGASSTASVTIVADNTPPLVELLSPAPDLLWSVGDPIAYSGRAVDPQDGLLPGANLTWSILIHHCDTQGNCHTHPVEDVTGDSGTFAAPDHEYPSFLELRLTATDNGVGGWWNPAFAHRRKLTFDNRAQAQNLDGFPVLVQLDPTRIDYGQVADNGADLRFVDSDGTTVLPYEIDTWTEAGVSTVWVRVPRIDAGSNTDHIWMYYGSPTATDAQDRAAVWAGYAGVWHLGASLADSSANANSGTNNGTTIVAGPLGSARRFNGASWIDAGNSASLQLTGQLSLEAWIAVDDPNQGGAPRVLSKKPVWDAAQGYNLEYHPAENNLTSVGSGNDYARADNVDLDTNWHWVGAAVSGASGRMYVDGLDRTTDASLSALIAGTQSMRFGRESAEFFLGRIDEIRVSPVARSAAWMAAQYLSMTNAFLSFGAEEQRGALSASASVEVHPVTVNLNFRSLPTSLDLGVGSSTGHTPFARTVIAGSSQSLSAPSPQTKAGGSFDFKLWSDGGAQSHNATAPAGGGTFTAYYQLPECADGIDNDGDGTVDFDGGPAHAAPDPKCKGDRFHPYERRGCGIGFELAFVLPPLVGLRARRRRGARVV